MEGDSVYFSRRAQAERDAASKAADDTARNIHLEMAERYDDLAAAIEMAQSQPDKLARAG